MLLHDLVAKPASRNIFAILSRPALRWPSSSPSVVGCWTITAYLTTFASRVPPTPGNPSIARSRPKTSPNGIMGHRSSQQEFCNRITPEIIVPRRAHVRLVPSVPSRNAANCIAIRSVWHRTTRRVIAPSQYTTRSLPRGDTEQSIDRIFSRTGNV
jgi:hypothetical protein